MLTVIDELCKWLTDGRCCETHVGITKADHQIMAYDLKVKFGMKPRNNPRAAT